MIETVRISYCAPAGDAGERWGDTHFARSFAAAFERSGIAAAVVPVESMPASPDVVDLAVHVRGGERLRPAGAAINALWIISNPGDVTDDEIAEFDLVLVASETFAAALAARTTTPVSVFHQATDIARFEGSGRSDAEYSGVVVVANYRFPYRPGPRWLRQLGYDFSIVGSGWEYTPERLHVVAEHVRNEVLGSVYRSATVIVADQLAEMSAHGFVANRLFDVGAAGGLVISTGRDAVASVFGDLVPTYETRNELATLLDELLDDESERRRRSDALTAFVREHHTFDRRAAELFSLVR